MTARPTDRAAALHKTQNTLHMYTRNSGLVGQPTGYKAVTHSPDSQSQAVVVYVVGQGTQTMFSPLISVMNDDS